MLVAIAQSFFMGFGACVAFMLLMTFTRLFRKDPNSTDVQIQKMEDRNQLDRAKVTLLDRIANAICDGAEHEENMQWRQEESISLSWTEYPETEEHREYWKATKYLGGMRFEYQIHLCDECDKFHLAVGTSDEDPDGSMCEMNTLDGAKTEAVRHLRSIVTGEAC